MYINLCFETIFHCFGYTSLPLNYYLILLYFFIADFDSDSTTTRRRRRRRRRRSTRTVSPESVCSYSDVIESVGKQIDTNIERQSDKKFKNQVRSLVKEVLQESCDDDNSGELGYDSAEGNAHSGDDPSCDNNKSRHNQSDVTVSTTLKSATKITDDVFAAAEKRVEERRQYLHDEVCERYNYDPGTHLKLQRGQKEYYVYWSIYNALRDADPFFNS